VQERFAGLAALKVLPKTGRTHQIRVHLAHIGCPVLCDKLYAGHAKFTHRELRRLSGADQAAAADDDVLLARQALHARRIKLAHPATGGPVEFIAQLPADLSALLDELRHMKASGRREPPGNAK
jgi:23S rRNA pseudouridine1911/1915/1917 synthase